MVKNILGGKKYKKNKKESYLKRELIFKEDGQNYARVISLLGDSRVKCQSLENNREIFGHIRGTLKKRVWINIGDIVLISIRNFDNNKCDIIHKYTFEEVNILKNMGQISPNINLQSSSIEISNSTDCDIDYGFDFINA